MPGAGNAGSVGESFSARPEVRRFVQDMADRHGFAPAYVQALMDQVQPSAQVLQLISPAAPTFKRSWSAYRARFLDAVRLREGARFWADNAAALARAKAEYGVPEEVIVSIIGIETVYGRNTGGFRVLDALATLAFDYPPRADYFRGELEQYLLYAREANLDPLSVRGSYAGAIGLPQFMPRSLRNFAADFDGDGRIDLRASATDAIGSVARFLSMHGWQPGARAWYPVRIEPDATLAPLIDAGIEPRATLAQMQPYGVRAVAGQAPPAGEKLALIDLPDGDAPTVYRLGANNFYVVTRYNRSSFYASAVLDLADALREARAGQSVDAGATSAAATAAAAAGSSASGVKPGRTSARKADAKNKAGSTSKAGASAKAKAGTAKAKATNNAKAKAGAPASGARGRAADRDQGSAPRGR